MKIQDRKNSSCAIVGIDKNTRPFLLGQLSIARQALAESDPTINTKLEIHYVNYDLVFPNVDSSGLRSILDQIGIFL
ncbi:hypothetical protein [Vibrio navarrensis]|uniref:hypothetical protein n=1 Tax=Vibrio navarrensis TaxID=29495 RepID=UPI001269A872|nr:hypothetical protein [Vibrio navarrensis]